MRKSTRRLFRLCRCRLRATSSPSSGPRRHAPRIAGTNANGKTAEATRSTDPAVEASNRVDSGCAGLGVTLPNTCDEYPFATSLEGGSGASIRVVPSTANNSQGGILTQGYRSWRILDADKYYVRVVLDNPDVAAGNWLPSAYSEYFGWDLQERLQAKLAEEHGGLLRSVWPRLCRPTTSVSPGSFRRRP